MSEAVTFDVGRWRAIAIATQRRRRCTGRGGASRGRPGALRARAVSTRARCPAGDEHPRVDLEREAVELALPRRYVDRLVRALSFHELTQPRELCAFQRSQRLDDHPRAVDAGTCATISSASRRGFSMPRVRKSSVAHFTSDPIVHWLRRGLGHPLAEDRSAP